MKPCLTLPWINSRLANGKLKHGATLIAAIFVASLSMVDVARAELWFEDFTDGNISDSGIDWLFTQDHSISLDGLLLSTDNTASTGAGPDWPADRQGWSIRTQGRLMQDHGFFGLASMPTPGVDTGQGTWSVLADQSALMGIHGQFFGSTDSELRPFAEDVVVQLDTLDSTLRMWAWRAGEQPTEDIAPLMIEADLDVPNGAPAIWTRSDDGPSSALFHWMAISTEHMPVNVDLRTTGAEEIKIVVPNDLASVDGNGTSGDSVVALRAQILIPSSQFGDLPAGKHLITQIATRPDAEVVSPITSTAREREYRLSTTSVERLSTTYADNVGSDEMVVFEGDVTSSTAGGASGVKNFDYVTDLQTPFLYDPSQGNLLVESLWPHGSSDPARADLVSGSVMQRVGTFGFDMDLASEVSASEPHDVNIPVLQFTFVPAEVYADCSGNGSLTAADLACVSTITQRDLVLDHLGGLPGDLDGNGQVEFSDFLVLGNNFGRADAAYSEGNIDLVNGVDFGDFLIMANNFGATPSALAAVPEPIGALTLWLGLLSIVVYGRRRQ